MSRYPRSDAEETGSYTGQAFEEEGKQRHGRALIKEVWVCKYVFSSCIQLRLACSSCMRKRVRRTASRDPAGYTPDSRDPVPAEETRADLGVAPDYPSAEDSEDMSVTNSEVESAMNHRHRRTV